MKEAALALIMFGVLYFIAMAVLDWMERLLDRFFAWFDDFMLEVDEELDRASNALYGNDTEES